MPIFGHAASQDSITYFPYSPTISCYALITSGLVSTLCLQRVRRHRVIWPYLARSYVVSTTY
ncbi:hypothetical protein BV25DRAFT_991791 [Artomyces pyxidatus]|uniref:Uncharacterized protein n=1 Tax=Artomyces pyxidatus TaxID=48021 RepID=A0ACB8SWX3_9AGAM|nr:hypothetical protein BV25DRAFT_991791 [Artomyces pyxidatus]